MRYSHCWYLVTVEHMTVWLGALGQVTSRLSLRSSSATTWEKRESRLQRFKNISLALRYELKTVQ